MGGSGRFGGCWGSNFGGIARFIHKQRERERERERERD